MSLRKKTIQRSLFAASFIFAPAIINKLLFDNSLRVAGLHEAISELGVAIITGWYFLGQKENISKYEFIFPIAFVFLSIADAFYGFSALIPINSINKPLLIFIREPAYLIFESLLLAYFFIKIKSYIFDKISIIIISTVTFVFFFLNVKYNLLSLLKQEHVGNYFIIICWCYSLTKSLIQGICVSVILRSINLHSLLFFQFLFLMYVADLALMYQMNTLHNISNGSFVFEQSWQISSAVIFCLFFFNRKNPMKLMNGLTIYSSLRSYFSITFCLIIVTLYSALALLIMNIHDLLELTNILIVGYLIFFTANLCSLYISKKFMNITSILSKNKLFDISEAGKGFTFAKVSEKANFYEIDSFIQEYNHISKNANELLKAYVDQSKFSIIWQTTQILAHDFRKPFSQLQIVLEQFESLKSNPIHLEKSKIEIKKSIQNAEAMISDILNFSREVSLETKPICLATVLDFSIKQTFMAFQQNEKAPDIHFEYLLSHSLKPMLDEERMARVFSNVFTNAIEAICLLGRKNSGRVWIHTKNAVCNDSPTEFIEVIIGNDGPPFHEEDLSKLFQSFFTKGKKKGTGLGLASVDKIVRLHGGEVSAHNLCDNSGVEFILKLPASKELEPQPEHIQFPILPTRTSEILSMEPKNLVIHSASESGGSRRHKEILFPTSPNPSFDHSDPVYPPGEPGQKHLLCYIADDSSLIRFAMKHCLSCVLGKIIPSTIRTFESPEEMLSLAKAESPNLVFCDLHFGSHSKITGLDALSQLKVLHPLASLFLVSNVDKSEGERLAQEWGLSGFFNPTTKKEELAAVLDDFISLCV